MKKLTKKEEEILDRIDLFICRVGGTKEFLIKALNKYGYDTEEATKTIKSLLEKEMLLDRGNIIYINRSIYNK